MNKLILQIAFYGLFAAGLGGCVSADKLSYSVVSTEGDFEIRDYKSYLVAETTVDSTIEDAGNTAFRKLFNYISGDNKGQADIAMTSPVTQERSSEKIAMTAPVEQQKTSGGWTVAFIMPPSYTLETVPVPNNPDVKLRAVSARRMACIRYSGSWSEARYSNHLRKLENWLKEKEIKAGGDPVWARYNSPFALWFLRRNEILIQISSP